MEWQRKNVELAQRSVNRKLFLYYNGFRVVNGATAAEFRVSAEAIIVSAGLKEEFVELNQRLCGAIGFWQRKSQ